MGCDPQEVASFVMRKPVLSHVQFHFRGFVIHKLSEQLIFLLIVFEYFLILKKIKIEVQPVILRPS